MLSRCDQARMARGGWIEGGWKLCALRLVGWLLRSRLLLWHLQRRGIATVVWSYDDDDDFEEAFRLGVDGVVSTASEPAPPPTRSSLPFHWSAVLSSTQSNGHIYAMI